MTKLTTLIQDLEAHWWAWDRTGPIPYVRLPFTSAAEQQHAMALVQELTHRGWMVAIRQTGPQRSHFTRANPPPSGYLRISITSGDWREPKTGDPHG